MFYLPLINTTMQAPQTFVASMFSKLKHLISILSLLASIEVIGQAATYDFAATLGTYIPITGGNVFFSEGATFDDNTSASITIPDFSYSGTVYNLIRINTNGWCSFGTATTTTGYTPLSSAINGASAVLSPFGEDQQNSSISEIRYEDTGTEFVVQWKNVRRFGTDETLNYQVRLHYSDFPQTFSFVYGTMLPGADTNPQIGHKSTNAPGTIGGTLFNLTLKNIPAGTSCDWIDAVRGRLSSETMLLNSTTNNQVICASGTTFTFTPQTGTIVNPVTNYLAPNGISTTVGTINWTAPTNATQYDVQYRAVGDCGWTQFSSNQASTSAALTGLTPLTSYQVRVRAESATNSAAYSHAGLTGATTDGYTNTGYFTTLAGPATVTAVNGGNPLCSAGGQTVIIIGTSFVGVTSVTFNGVNALAFTVNSSTQITAVTPFGITEGLLLIYTSFMNPIGFNYSIVDLPDSEIGCTNNIACNYDPQAVCDDGSCLFFGCTDSNACNYDSNSGCDDGSCLYTGTSCNDNNPNNMLDVITSDCICAGTSYNYGNVPSGEMNTCPGSSFEPISATPPLNITEYQLQWYYSEGDINCPSGSSTAGWITITGANSLDLTIDEFDGTRTFACYITPDPDYGIPSQWMSGCQTLTYIEFEPEPIVGNPNITPFSSVQYAVNPIPGHTYFWSVTNGAITDGQNTSVIQVLWGQSGPYQVTLNESNGICSSISNLSVVNNECALSVTAVVDNPSGFCQGLENTITAVTTANDILYQWFLNGTEIDGAVSQFLQLTESGNYQVMITQDDCSAISQIVFVEELPEVILPTIMISNSNNDCTSNSAIISASGGTFTSFLWSDGSTTNSIEVFASGNYTLELSDAYGCAATIGPINVNLSISSPIPICLVTVDPLTGHNQVVWEPISSELINNYFVYKESDVANVFTNIGTIQYGSDGIFTDIISNSAVQASRYKLSVTDTCDIESSQSTTHKTIHLTSNLGLNNTINLIWSHYEGIDFSTYNIMKGSSLSDMTLLTTISSNLNSYTDIAEDGINTFYMIEVEGIACDPSRSIIKSQSNVVNHTPDNIVNFHPSINAIYPNPIEGELNVNIDEQILNADFVLMDALGKIKAQGKLYNTSNKITLAELGSGIYFLHIFSLESQLFYCKLIKK